NAGAREHREAIRTLGGARRDRFFFQAEDGIRDFHVTGVQTWLFRSCRRFSPGRKLPTVEPRRDPSTTFQRSVWSPTGYFAAAFRRRRIPSRCGLFRERSGRRL